MKIKVLLSGIAASLALAFAPIDDLNQAVQDLLLPLNNNITQAEVVFNALETDSLRALRADVFADYIKQGALAELNLKLSELSYDYRGGVDPLAVFQVDVITDLPALIDQQKINELGPALPDMIQGFADDFLYDYGNAASVQVNIDKEEYAPNGDLIGIEVSGTMTVDLSLLPVDIPVEDVPMTKLNLTLGGGIEGFKLHGDVTMNPKFYAFEEDQEGLKEIIDRLLTRDKATLDSLGQTAEDIDATIEDIVNNGF